MTTTAADFEAVLAQPPRQPLRARTEVPLREVPQHHRHKVLEHLLALDERDRYLRFGLLAGDRHIERYVNGLQFGSDELYGYYDENLNLVALAHLGYSPDGKAAEFGGSVNKSLRGMGMGQQLFDRAVLHCRNRGLNLLYIHALTENRPMLRIARKAGARVERDGEESEAYLTLPAATSASRLEEALDERVADTDYRMKKQLRNYQQFLQRLQGFGMLGNPLLRHHF